MYLGGGSKEEAGRNGMSKGPEVVFQKSKSILA